MISPGYELIMAYGWPAAVVLGLLGGAWLAAVIVALTLLSRRGAL